MQTIEWDDVTLLGRRVLIYDIANREGQRPRAGIVTGPGVEAGCVCVAEFRRENLDDNAALVRYFRNVLLVRRIADRPPGNSQIALLVDEAIPLQKAHAEAYGGRPQDLPRGELKTPQLALAGNGLKPEPGDEDDWEEATGDSSRPAPPKVPSVKTEDDDEGPDEKPIPPSKSEALVKWAKSEPLRQVSTAKIVDDNTVDFAIEIGDQLVDFIRIKWVDGGSDHESGYVLRLADVSGKMTMNMGSAVSYCKTETEIESLLKIAKILISKLSGSKTTEEAHHRFKAGIEDFRAGKISV